MRERNTVQKEIVLQTVLTLQDHPTADEVHETIAQKHPSISKATVYRNLNALAEKGKIRHVSLPDGADCYDHRTDEHYHIRCLSCKRVYDAQLPYMHGLTEKARRAEGSFQLTGHNLTFEGICPDCRQHD